MNKYIWLIKHLILNHSKPKDNIFWIKCSEEDAKQLQQEYPLVENRLLYGGATVAVVRILDNNIVLDTRQNKPKSLKQIVN